MSRKDQLFFCVYIFIKKNVEKINYIYSFSGINKEDKKHATIPSYLRDQKYPSYYRSSVHNYLIKN